MHISHSLCIRKPSTSLRFVFVYLLADEQLSLNNEDKILIKNLYLFKNYGAKKLIKEFPEKDWKRRTLNYFLLHVPTGQCAIAPSMRYSGASSS